MYEHSVVLISRTNCCCFRRAHSYQVRYHHGLDDDTEDETTLTITDGNSYSTSHHHDDPYYSGPRERANMLHDDTMHDHDARGGHAGAGGGVAFVNMAAEDDDGNATPYNTSGRGGSRHRTSAPTNHNTAVHFTNRSVPDDDGMNYTAHGNGHAPTKPPTEPQVMELITF